jgi:hypothetical protein
VLLALSAPANHERGPRYMAQVLAALHAAARGRSIALEFGRHAETVGLYCRAATSLAKDLEKQLAAAYPELAIERLEDTALRPPHGSLVAEAKLSLAADVMPIDTCDAFEDRLSRELTDPLAGVLGVLAAGAEAMTWSHVAIEITPAARSRCAAARRILDRYYTSSLCHHPKRGRWYLHAVTSPNRLNRALGHFIALIYYRRQNVSPAPEGNAAYAKQSQPLFTARIQLTVAAPNANAARRQLQQISSAFAPYTVNSKASFRTVAAGQNRRGSLFSVDELAILFHPSTSGVRAERMEQVHSRKFEPPAFLPSPAEPGTVVLGTTDFRRRKEAVALRSDDRLRHLFVVGKTGTGKSTLLMNLVSDDVRHGRGVGLIDPHGDLVSDVLRRIPRGRRTNDVILFDPAAHPIAFNPLACDRPEQRPLVAAGVLSAMKKVFAIDETNAPRLLYVLRNVLMALVEQPQATLLDIPRMLTDEAFRRQIVNRLSDPLVRSFWQSEFAGWHDRYRIEAIAPIQNKVGQFLTSPLLRRVFESPRNSLDLRRVMDTGQILLVNLSHGRLGEDSAALLGALLVTAIEQAAKSRADVAEVERRPFYLYADEFQTYAGTQSLQIILSQARKYGLSLCLATQLVDQMSPELAATVFGNVGSLCVMQVGRRDAEQLAEELGGDVTPEDLIALPKYHAALRILVDGEPTRPFTIRTSPPAPVTARHADANLITRISSQRHTRVPV